MRVVETFAEARRAATGTLALVPTMGFLHEGHLSHMSAARESVDTVMVSIWVNPLQFDDPADLGAYPRDLDRDLALCEGAGVDVVFFPSAEEMRPAVTRTTVSVAGVTEGMEGAHRPGHFDGVATVVAQLLSGLRPDRAHFGRKDAQQLAVVTTMVKDLSMPVEIVPGSTVREPDGLALSSRNVRLAPDDRRSALGISGALLAAADRFGAGHDPNGLPDLVRSRMARVGLAPEYVALVDAHTMAPVTTVEDEVVLATACRVGPVRLIDNVVLSPHGVDRGVRLDRPSALYG